MNFADQVVVISGASSGIGKQCCEMMLERQCNVMGADVNPSTINHDLYNHYEIDIRDEKEVEKFINETASRFQKIDGLVNGAGVFSNSKPFYELDSTLWDKVISINLTGMYLLSKYVVIESRGHV